MARVSKATITPLLEEFARLDARRISIELQRDRELLPLKESYEKKAAPIVDGAKAKLDSISKRLAELAGNINAQLMSGVDEKAGTIALSQVTVDIEVTKSVAAAIAKANKAEAQDLRTSDGGKPLVQALAEVQVKDGAREVDAQSYFNFVKPSDRGASFWGSLKVLIGEAEKLLGGKIDELAKKPKKYSIGISLKT